MSFFQLRSRQVENIQYSTPSASVVLTGTITGAIDEDSITTGGDTIILTVTGDTWVTSGATFDAIRQDIIDGIDSAQSEANGWDAIVKAGLAVTDVVRTSDTVVTITLPAFATYDITAQETITATVPASALSLGASAIAAPTFTIDSVAVVSSINLFALLGVG